VTDYFAGMFVGAVIVSTLMAIALFVCDDEDEP